MNYAFEDRTMLRMPEVAALIGVPYTTLRSWVLSGTDIPYYQVPGKQAVFDQAEVLAWWAGKRKGARPAAFTKRAAGHLGDTL